VVRFDAAGIHPQEPRGLSPVDDSLGEIGGAIDEPRADAHTRLLGNYDRGRPGCGPEAQCTHGTFSPRPETMCSVRSSEERYENDDGLQNDRRRRRGEATGVDGGLVDGIWGLADGIRGLWNGKAPGTTRVLADRHGVKNQKVMCVVSVPSALCRGPEWIWRMLIHRWL
jgi:hypothetical protein